MTVHVVARHRSTVSRRRLLVAAVMLALGACRHGGVARTAAHALRPIGPRLLVLAPHPDDEVLGAGGLIRLATAEGTRTTVVVATNGEAGVDKTHAGADLGGRRALESRAALARLGVSPDAERFLGWADGRLANAWSERWTATRADGAATSADAIVDDLRGLLRETSPTTVVLPMSLDEHPDHRALNRFGLLALLGERTRVRPRDVLGFPIHAGRGWPGDGPLPACARQILPWRRLDLGTDVVLEKSSLIGLYRTQVSRGLLRYARPEEPFGVGNVVPAGRLVGPTHPGVQRRPDGIVVSVPRGDCVLAAGDGLRLRFFRSSEGRAEAVEERIVRLGHPPAVRGGRAGNVLSPAEDVRVRRTAGAVHLLLDAAVGDGGAVLEVLPAVASRPAPAWLLLW
jgi:LmbE family N-acetylglucosaminyl deacetylase